MAQYQRRTKEGSTVRQQQRRNSRWGAARKRAGQKVILSMTFCITMTVMNTFNFMYIADRERDQARQNLMELFLSAEHTSLKLSQPENNNNDTEKSDLTYLSPTAKMANEMMRTKGVLLRWEESQTELRDQNGRDYMPASFVHASMQAPNVMFKWQIEDGGRGEFETGPRVSYLIGTKFEPDMQLSNLEQKVDCRAYVPINGWSNMRNHQIQDNPLGNSCSIYQIKHPMNLYNVTNGCSCNYDTVPGKDIVEYFIQNTTIRNRRQFGLSQCWYPGSSEGIRHLIHASNSIFHKREKLWIFKSIPTYQGWTECSGSTNIQEPRMIDALVVSLPLLPKGENYDNGHFEDLDTKAREKLKNILYGFAHLNLPVLLFQEKKGIDPKDCQLLWEGLNCEESFSKLFLSKELEFEDGSCLAIAEGDEEVRFYQAGSSNCTVNKILRDHNPLWASYRHKSLQRNNQGTQNETTMNERRNDIQSLTLILTGDVHGKFLPSLCEDEKDNDTGSRINMKCGSDHGAPYLARLVNKIRSVEENVILLDTGDAFWGGVAGGGEPEIVKLVADTMNLLKYDVMALGNHEPDLGAAALHQLKEMINFPIVASNVQGPEAAALNIKSHVMIPFGNNGRYHLCVVGVTALEVYPFVKNLAVTPGIDSVLETLRNLMHHDPSCDRVVILSHAGIDFDKELSNKLASLSRTEAEIPVVDAILGGHTHDLVASNMNKVDDSATLAADSPSLLHTGAYGQHAGLLQFVWNVTSNSLVNAQSEILPLDEVHGVYPDNDYISDLVSRKHAIDAAEILLKRQRPIEGRIKIVGNMDTDDEELHECGESCRLGDCVLGQIITDAMRFCVESEYCLNDKLKQPHLPESHDNFAIALLESGTVRSCFDPQKQTFDNILPWPNKLVVLRVTGDVILKMLQHGLSTKASSTRGGGFLQVSGLKYKFTDDHLLIEESICLDKNIRTPAVPTTKFPPGSCMTALDVNDVYTVVVTDWLAAGGDGFGDLLGKGTVVLESNPTITDAISYYREVSKADLEYSTLSQFSRSEMQSSSSTTGSSSSISGMAGFLGGAISYILTYPLYALFIEKAMSSEESSLLPSQQSFIQLLSRKLYDGVWLVLTPG